MDFWQRVEWKQKKRIEKKANVHCSLVIAKKPETESGSFWDSKEKNSFYYNLKLDVYRIRSNQQDDDYCWMCSMFNVQCSMSSP